MVGTKKTTLDVSGTDGDNSGNDESFESVDNGSDVQASEESDQNIDGEDGLAENLADCSISPVKKSARKETEEESENCDDEESYSEEIEEEPKKSIPTKKIGDKPASGRPKFSEMILDAVTVSVPSRSGVSYHQIKRLIHEKYPELTTTSDIYIKNNLKRLVDNEMLIKVTGTGATGSYKLAPSQKKKAGTKSKANPGSAKVPSKNGSKSDGAVKSTTKASSKSPMKKVGRPPGKSAGSKVPAAAIKQSSVKLTKLAVSKSKAVTIESSKSDNETGSAKPKGRPPKKTAESAAPKSPAAKLEVSAQSKSATNGKATKTTAKSKPLTPKSPKAKAIAPKSPKAKAISPKSPKAKAIAPKSPKAKAIAPKAKATAPKSPKTKPVVTKSGTQKAPVSKTKLDDASDAGKSAPGPAPKRGKKV